MLLQLKLERAGGNVQATLRGDMSYLTRPIQAMLGT